MEANYLMWIRNVENDGRLSRQRGQIYSMTEDFGRWKPGVYWLIVKKAGALDAVVLGLNAAFDFKIPKEPILYIGICYFCSFGWFDIECLQ